MRGASEPCDIKVSAVLIKIGKPMALLGQLRSLWVEDLTTAEQNVHCGIHIQRVAGTALGEPLRYERLVLTRGRCQVRMECYARVLLSDWWQFKRWCGHGFGRRGLFVFLSDRHGGCAVKGTLPTGLDESDILARGDLEIGYHVFGALDLAAPECIDRLAFRGNTMAQVSTRDIMYAVDRSCQSRTVHRKRRGDGS